jgi:nucleotide-binding universal stress UspA family protein
MTFQKLLVPTDFSPRAAEATRLAADIARRYGAQLTLLHVHHPVAYELPAGHVQNMPSELDRVYVGLDESLATARELALAAGATRVDTRIVQGPVAREIVAFADGFDLVVMGMTGARGIERMVSGSITEKVMAAAPCPVLIARERQGR